MPNNNNTKLKVVKVPISDNERIITNPPNFNNVSQLYLELIENKDKIKQSLVNKEYVPSKTLPNIPFINDNTNPTTNTDTTTTFENKQNNNEVKKEYDDYSDDDKSKSRDTYDDDKSRSRDTYDDDKSRSKDTYDDDKSRSKDSDKSLDSYDKSRTTTDSSYSSKSKSRSYSSSSDSSYKSKNSHLSDRLKELLQEDSRKEKSRSKKASGSHKNNIPSLKELEDKGNITREQYIPDIERVQQEEIDEDDLKRELLFKFELLKKSYRGASIPEFSIHSDYKNMSKTYEETVRKLSLDSTVDNYKNYLVGGFMFMEYVLSNFLKLDMQGFTQQQVLNMQSYERLLIELGEKSYVPGGSNWPVELRLVFIIIINAAFFVISKILMKKTGSNIMNLINSMNTPMTSSSIPQKKRKMKGPDVDLDILDE